MPQRGHCTTADVVQSRVHAPQHCGILAEGQGQQAVTAAHHSGNNGLVAARQVDLHFRADVRLPIALQPYAVARDIADYNTHCRAIRRMQRSCRTIGRNPLIAPPIVFVGLCHRLGELCAFFAAVSSR